MPETMLSKSLAWADVLTTVVRIWQSGETAKVNNIVNSAGQS